MNPQKTLLLVCQVILLHLGFFHFHLNYTLNHKKIYVFIEIHLYKYYYSALYLNLLLNLKEFVNRSIDCNKTKKDDGPHLQS